MRTRTRITLAGVVLGAALISGVAWATIPSDAGVYTACKLTAIGTIRLIDPSLPSTSLLSHCTSLETQITWNQKGQKGDTGSTGAAGKDGTNGVNGKDGVNGLPGTNGTNGAPCLSTDPACKGPKGDTGATGPTGPAGSNGTNGTNGAACLSSDPACKGAKGDQGDPGTNGTDGTNGATGPQGPPGAKGDPGTVGAIDVQDLVAHPHPLSSDWFNTVGNVWQTILLANCPTGYKALNGSLDGNFGTTFTFSGLTPDHSAFTVTAQRISSGAPITGFTFTLRVQCVGIT